MAIIPSLALIRSELLSQEKTANADLQLTWQRANEHFLEVQRVRAL